MARHHQSGSSATSTNSFSFGEEYLRCRRNMYTGYVGVSAWTIILHSYDNYGIITAVDIEDNDTKMRTEYDPSLPIEFLFHQIEEDIEYVTTGE